MIQTDEEIKKEFREKFTINSISGADAYDAKNQIADWWLSKFHTLQEEFKNSHHKVFTRSEWVRYQVVIEDKIREEYKKEIECLNYRIEGYENVNKQKVENAGNVSIN